MRKVYTNVNVSVILKRSRLRREKHKEHAFSPITAILMNIFRPVWTKLEKNTIFTNSLPTNRKFRLFQFVG